MEGSREIKVTKSCPILCMSNRWSGGLQQVVRAKTETLMEDRRWVRQGREFQLQSGPYEPPTNWSSISVTWSREWKLGRMVKRQWKVLPLLLTFSSFLSDFWFSSPLYLGDCTGTFTTSVPPFPLVQAPSFPYIPRVVLSLLFSHTEFWYYLSHIHGHIPNNSDLL